MCHLKPAEFFEESGPVPTGQKFEPEGQGSCGSEWPIIATPNWAENVWD